MNISISKNLFLLLFLALAACSGSSNENTQTPAGNTPAVPDDPIEASDDPAPSDPVTLPEPGNAIDPSLEPLPSPPLTAAPDADDEPRRVTTPTTTVTRFFLVQDPAVDIKDPADQLTNADFEAGPLPARTYWPAGLDIGDNQPPYFAGLDDQQVYAGETLDVVLRPVDPDGGLPGMFPNALPVGARYIDNLNGTRTLRWRPLQPDVGILEFTITAVDPEEPGLRTERTIRIKVDMPSDPSGIVNLPPGINMVRPHTVRVNDPVVIEIKGTDPNGTVPKLEIPNQPPGATLVPHYRYPGISVLQFRPQAAGTLELEVIATDVDAPYDTAHKTISIDVRPADDFLRDGSRLRQLASQRDLLFGFAALQNFYHRPDGALYADIGAQEFNFVSSENSLKWDLINPLPGRFQWASADNLVSYARTRRLAVHGHTLIWHRQLPAWIHRSDPDDRETHMREYIDRVLNRYAKDIPVWDVVNEALEEDGSLRVSVWSEAMGINFIDTAFRQARASAPDATLLYNDYDIAWAGDKSDGLLDLLQTLKDQDTPIDGVGFQMHLFAKFDQDTEVAAIFQKVADLDLDIYITELDVSMENDDTETRQAEVYERVLSLCLDQPRCKAFQTWGYTDMYSWRRQFKPLLLDHTYQPKPAYYALQERLAGN